MLCSHFTQNCIFCTFWRLKILVLWRKIVENLLIFVYLFCPKNGAVDFTKTFITQEWLVVESSSTPRWITLLMLYRLVYNIRSHFGLKCLIQWTEVATSTACNFINSWPICLNFSNMINLCHNIWSIENSKCQQFVFWKTSRQKTQIFHILKGRFSIMGCPIDINFGVVWETPVDFLKSVVLQLFPKNIQSNANLNVKSSSKFNCLEKVEGLF